MGKHGTAGAAALLCAASLSVQGADWRWAGINADSSWYVDAGSIQHHRAVTQLWIASVWRDPQPDWDQPEKTMQSAVQLVSFDCAARRFLISNITSYDGHGASVSSFNMPAEAQKDGWTDVVPDSIGDALSGLVCNRLAQLVKDQDLKVGNPQAHARKFFQWLEQQMRKSRQQRAPRYNI